MRPAQTCTSGAHPSGRLTRCTSDEAITDEAAAAEEAATAEDEAITDEAATAEEEAGRGPHCPWSLAPQAKQSPSCDRKREWRPPADTPATVTPAAASASMTRGLPTCAVWLRNPSLPSAGSPYASALPACVRSSACEVPAESSTTRRAAEGGRQAVHGDAVGPDHAARAPCHRALYTAPLTPRTYLREGHER